MRPRTAGNVASFPSSSLPFGSQASGTFLHFGGTGYLDKLHSSHNGRSKALFRHVSCVRYPRSFWKADPKVNMLSCLVLPSICAGGKSAYNQTEEEMGMPLAACLRIVRSHTESQDHSPSFLFLFALGPWTKSLLRFLSVIPFFTPASANRVKQSQFQKCCLCFNEMALKNGF